jgi:hypothetical protein
VPSMMAWAWASGGVAFSGSVEHEHEGAAPASDGFSSDDRRAAHGSERPGQQRSERETLVHVGFIDRQHHGGTTRIRSSDG